MRLAGRLDRLERAYGVNPEARRAVALLRWVMDAGHWLAADAYEDGLQPPPLLAEAFRQQVAEDYWREFTNYRITFRPVPAELSAAFDALMGRLGGTWAERDQWPKGLEELRQLVGGLRQATEGACWRYRIEGLLIRHLPRDVLRRWQAGWRVPLVHEGYTIKLGDVPPLPPCLWVWAADELANAFEANA
jgi:hypothetical protein